MHRIARQMTLWQRLLAIVAVAIVPVVIGLAFLIAAGHRQRGQEVRDQALRTSQIVALEMERIVTGAQAVLQVLAVSPSVRFPGCRELVEEMDAALPQLSGFVIAGPDGIPTCATGAIGGVELKAQPWFAEAFDRRGLAVGTYTTGPGSPYLPVAISTEDARPRVLATAIDLAWLGARLRERELAAGSVLTVADREGTLLAREPEPERFIGRQLAADFAPLLDADRPGAAELRSPDGTLRIVGFQPPAATASGLYVGAGISKDAAFAPINASTRSTVLLVAAGAGAACLVAWLVGDRLFRRPIRRMLATVASWRAGDETARTGIEADASELSELAAAIDGYMENLVAVRAERAAVEERRSLLLREMNHRIKNLLATVQAIANQTFKDRATPDSLRAFGSRLAAMAAAHDLLVTEHWESSDLQATVAAALAPFGAGRFGIEGPRVRITARAAVSLSMVLHELATNAAKYGALGVPAGQVAVRWWLEEGESGERFRFTWTESGGPPVEEPDRRGFGTKLIETALASEVSGTSRLVFARSGLSFSLDADADTVLADRSLPQESAA